MTLSHASDRPRGLLRVVKVDLAAQYAIIPLLALKPGWTDRLLIVPALILGLGLLSRLRGAAIVQAGSQPA